MTPRLDDFKGLDVEYIHYLEKTVLSLRHRLRGEGPRDRQDLDAIRSQLSCNTSTTDAEENTPQNTTAHDLAHAPAPASECFNLPATARKRRRLAKDQTLEFVPYHPHNVQEKVVPVPRWRRPAQELIRETPVVTQWMSRLHQTGLYEAMESNRALTYLLDTTVTPDMSTGDKSVSDDTLNYVRQYAQAAAMRSVKASAVLKLANFQKFLVLSACAVLLNEGYKEEAVLDAAKLCIGTNIDGVYCKRLVQSSKFVNRLIDNLNIQGWGHRASELLILWNRSPSWYFNLASYSAVSLQYLTDELCTQDLMDPHGTTLDSAPWTALFVPSIVCNILGNKFSVESISQILGYKKAYLLRIRKNTWKLQHSQSHVEQRQEQCSTSS